MDIYEIRASGHFLSTGGAKVDVDMASDGSLIL